MELEKCINYKHLHPRRGRGEGSHMKTLGMLIVLFWDANHGFLSHLRCSGQCKKTVISVLKELSHNISNSFSWPQNYHWKVSSIRWKKTKAIILNHKGIRMGKTGKDFNTQNYNQWTWKIWIEDEGLMERIKLNWNQG